MLRKIKCVEYYYVYVIIIIIIRLIYYYYYLGDKEKRSDLFIAICLIC